MNSDTLSMKAIINELDLLKKAVIQWKVWKKRFVIACNQINKKNSWLQ